MKEMKNKEIVLSIIGSIASIISLIGALVSYIFAAKSFKRYQNAVN